MDAPAQAPQRYVELDSLRGLAALTVVFGHFLHIFPHGVGGFALANLVAAADRMPISILFAGHEAVILFFILSGFVLSLPYLDRQQVNYGSYLIRRVFRIYVPYVCSVIGAVAANTFIYKGGLDPFSNWFNRVWAGPVSPASIVNHVVLLGSFSNAEFNPVYWSLVHEMRISLFFPFVALCVLHLSWKQALAAGLGVSFAAVIMNKIAGAGTDYFYTFHYLGFFVVGHLLAAYRAVWKAWYQRTSRLGIWVTLCAAIGCYTGGRYLCFVVLQDWMIGAGASLFIVLSLHSSSAKSFLNFRPIRFLGQISYSLYLWHVVVLVSAVHLFYGKIPIGWLLGCAFGAALLFSSASYYWIEVPAMRAGKKLIEILRRGRRWETANQNKIAELGTVMAVESTSLSGGTKGLSA
jgi:peptidoglycan/LPS O-acetylase OafA/YrhL